jgi:hypothetical protein
MGRRCPLNSGMFCYTESLTDVHIHDNNQSYTSWTNVNMLIFLARGSYSVETDAASFSQNDMIFKMARYFRHVLVMVFK